MADGTDEFSARDRPTMAPFLGALAVIVFAVIVVVLLNTFGGDGLSEEQKETFRQRSGG